MVDRTAEEYAELLGAHVHDGRFPGPAQIIAELRATWPMVTASYGPLAVLLVRLAGASPARNPREIRKPPVLGSSSSSEETKDPRQTGTIRRASSGGRRRGGVE